MLRHVKAAFTAGELGRKFFRRFGLREEIIYNAFFSHDVAVFREFYQTCSVSSRKTIRERLGVKDDEFVVLCIARLLDWKRVEDLAKALLIIDQEHTEIASKMHFVLIGDGECLDHETLVAQYRSVTFHHEKRVEYDEVKAWFCAADLFGFPSEGDIWGLVVNEALSLGLPVVCTDRIGSAELVRDGWNGYVIKTRSPEQMADRIVSLYRQPALLAQMREHALSIWDAWNSDKGLAELKRLVRDVVFAESKG